MIIMNSTEARRKTRDAIVSNNSRLITKISMAISEACDQGKDEVYIAKYITANEAKELCIYLSHMGYNVVVHTDKLAELESDKNTQLEIHW